MSLPIAQASQYAPFSQICEHRRPVFAFLQVKDAAVASRTSPALLATHYCIWRYKDHGNAAMEVAPGPEVA